MSETMVAQNFVYHHTIFKGLWITKCIYFETIYKGVLDRLYTPANMRRTVNCNLKLIEKNIIKHNIFL